MPLALITPAAAPAVTLAEARAFLRIGDSIDEATDEDTLIAELVAAATDQIERMTGRSFVRAEWQLTLRCFPLDHVIRLPRAPVASVESVKYRDRDGSLVTLTSGTDFLADLAAEPGTVEPVTSWPVTGDYPDAVQVRFIAGYAPDDGSPVDHAANVPARAKVCIKGLAHHWFENRTPIAETGWHEAPANILRLITGLRVWA